MTSRRGRPVWNTPGQMRALAGPPSEDRSARLDWGRIEAWAQQVAGGDLGQINAVFEANGALAPRVLWQPTGTQIQTPQLRFLWDYWTNLKGDARLPASRSVDLSALPPISGSFLDVVDDGRDFRFRRCSAAILALADDDLAGRLISEAAVGSSVVYIIESAIAFYCAAYRSCVPGPFNSALAGAGPLSSPYMPSV